ncbi:MAG: hypothetical protein ACRCZ2_01920, partial [Fusobacteriaceae bacterium]
VLLLYLASDFSLALHKRLYKMVYYLKSSDTWFKVEYPCYGVLCEMNVLSSASWEGDIQFWSETGSLYSTDQGGWADFEHQGYSAESEDYTALPGFTPDEIEAIYTVNEAKVEFLPDHDMLQHISIVTDDEADIPDGHAESYFKLDMSEVPCDELFIPMFMVRNLFGDGGGSTPSLYNKFISQGHTPLEAFVFANIWYESTRSSWAGGFSTQPVYYVFSEDGAVFKHCRIGDIVHLLRGGMPNFMSSKWGELFRGYPAYGVGDFSKSEPLNPYTGRKHTISSCTVVNTSYDDKFLNRRLDNDGSYLDPEELDYLIKEIKKHVEQGT